jgi:hypothetical protein
MGRTAPRTYIPGETETATIFNTDHRDNLIYLMAERDALVAGVSRGLYVDVATHTGTGTGETDASTYTLPGGTLATNGDMLVFRWLLKLAAGTSTRTVKLWWNGASVATITSTAASSFIQLTTGVLWRTGATSQAAYFLMRTGSTALNTATMASATATGDCMWDGTSPTNATLANNVAIKTTVQDSAAGTNITQVAFAIELVRASSW